MKRLLISAAMFLCSLLTFAQFSGSGSGTESDPYRITNPIHFNQLRNFLNQTDVYFKVLNNIDMSEFLEEENPSEGWQPVGSNAAPFKGVLDGNGKTISGLWTKRNNTDYVGLFGKTSEATIKNITIADASIIGNSNVGGIVGYCDNTTISGVTFSGKIQSSGSDVGGIVGLAADNVTISDISVTVDLTSTSGNVGGVVGHNGATTNFSATNCQVINSKISGTSNVGGFCGANIGNHKDSNKLSSCYVQADVKGTSHVGGVCGHSENSYHTINMDNCGFIGNVVASSYVGGLSGYVKKTGRYCVDTFNNCFALGSVSATGDYAGGLVGYDEGYYYSSYGYYYYNNIINSYFSGSVSGKNYTAGLVGYKKYGTISNCYSSASVAGAKYVGGLVGYNSVKTTLKSSVAISTRVTATEGEVARIVGKNDGTIGTMGTADENKSYNRTIVISQGVAQEISDDLLNGTGVSKTTLKLKATYVAMGWDFTDSWRILETECFPYMKSQTAPPVITSKTQSGATTISGKCIDGGTVYLEVDGVKQQMVGSDFKFSFTVDPLQSGHLVRASAQATGKQPSYYTTEEVSFLGKGTEADPYQIYTAADLTQVYRKGYYKLMNDIDLTNYINEFYGAEGWESIGHEGSETIYFDGDGHKITGLWCNSTRDNTGLFSCFANGYIKNLTVETAKGKQVKGGNNTGIIIGKLINGEMTNCKVYGTVSGGTPVGGMLGNLQGGKMTRCQSDVIINTSIANCFVGGLAGEAKGTITTCQSSCTLNATGSKTYAGGLIGRLTGSVSECLSVGTLKGTGSDSYVGGLIGMCNAGSNVINNYSNAKTNSALYAAGLVAYNYGVVEKCYATGDVFSSNYGAGVVGYNDGTGAIVKNCVATSNRIEVDYESQSAQSGGYGMRIIGGFKNDAPEPEMNNYALKAMQVSVNNVVQVVYDDVFNGVAKNGTELAQANTYKELGWDFANVWSITENQSLPLLRNNIAEVISKPEDGPEPIETFDDILTVAETPISLGKNATISINLENKTTDFTAYQFDLTLPNGFTLAEKSEGKYEVTKTERYEDENQSLKVTLQDGTNTYRIICFSLENGTINNTSGSILNVVVTAGTDLLDGDYEAKISNIVFTKTDGTQLKLSEAKFNFVIRSIIMGDANGDGEVNVTDIVEIVNAIMNKPSTKFVKAAADMNNDGEINVTDIVQVVNLILSADVNKASRRVASTEQNDHDMLRLVKGERGMISLELDNRGGYVASQFDIRLNEGQQLNAVSLNSLRGSNHHLIYKEVGSNLYRVIVYSMEDEMYSGNQGELLNIDVNGNGNVVIDNILFVTDSHAEKYFLPLYTNTTGISDVETEQELDVYSINGSLIRKQASSVDGLEKGIYVINGKKLVVK